MIHEYGTIEDHSQPKNEAADNLCPSSSWHRKFVLFTVAMIVSLLGVYSCYKNNTMNFSSSLLFLPKDIEESSNNKPIMKEGLLCPNGVDGPWDECEGMQGVQACDHIIYFCGAVDVECVVVQVGQLSQQQDSIPNDSYDSRRVLVVVNGSETAIMPCGRG